MVVVFVSIHGVLQCYVNKHTVWNQDVNYVDGTRNIISLWCAKSSTAKQFWTHRNYYYRGETQQIVSSSCCWTVIRMSLCKLRCILLHCNQLNFEYHCCNFSTCCIVCCTPEAWLLCEYSWECDFLTPTFSRNWLPQSWFTCSEGSWYFHLFLGFPSCSYFWFFPHFAA